MTPEGAHRQPSPDTGIGHALRVRALGRRARTDLVRLAVLRVLARREEFAVRLPAGPVFVAARSLHGDLGRLVDAFANETHGTDYAGATVLDIGAGKGYFAAYALAQGAAVVRSYEPQGESFGALERAAGASRSAGWTVHRAAVRGRSATPVPAGGGGPESPDVVAAERILPQVAPAEGRLIVRLDPRAEQCDIVLGTPPNRWNVVDELFVPLGGDASCDACELVTHLERAGLVLRGALDERAGSPDLRFAREQPRGIRLEGSRRRRHSR